MLAAPLWFCRDRCCGSELEAADIDNRGGSHGESDAAALAARKEVSE
jgi:hypothetical protein